MAKARIFLVDDHEGIRIGLEYLFKDAGHEVVVSVASLKAAIEKWDADPHVANIIISDHSLNPGTGIDFFNHVRKGSKTPFILISAEDRLADHPLVKSGEITFVEKYGDTKKLEKELLGAIEKALSAQEPEAAPKAKAKTKPSRPRAKKARPGAKAKKKTL